MVGFYVEFNHTLRSEVRANSFSLAPSNSLMTKLLQVLEVVVNMSVEIEYINVYFMLSA